MKVIKKKHLMSFSWLRYPHQWLFVAALLVLAVGLGLVAYQKPLRYTLDVGGADSPFIMDMGSRNISATRTSRWTEGESGLVLSGINASHPLTLSLYVSGEARSDIQAGHVVSFTLSINGHKYPTRQLPTSYSWMSWHIDKRIISNGQLDIHLIVPTQPSGVIIWPIGLLLDKLTIEPDTDRGQQLTDYLEVDWRNLAYLATIVLLTYSFFAGASRSWVVLLGLIISIIMAVALASLLGSNRPLFAVFGSSVAMALLVIRLLWPLVAGESGRRHPALWLFALGLAITLLLLPLVFNHMMIQSNI